MRVTRGKMITLFQSLINSSFSYRNSSTMEKLDSNTVFKFTFFSSIGILWIINYSFRLAAWEWPFVLISSRYIDSNHYSLIDQSCIFSAMHCVAFFHYTREFFSHNLSHSRSGILITTLDDQTLRYFVERARVNLIEFSVRHVRGDEIPVSQFTEGCNKDYQSNLLEKS